MILVGCDLHTRKQQVAVLNTDTGELLDQELLHTGHAVEQFYAALPPPVTVGIESTGYSLWFHALLQQLGHSLLVPVRAFPVCANGWLVDGNPLGPRARCVV